MANEGQGQGDLTGIIKDLMNRRAKLDAAITALIAASGAMIPDVAGSSLPNDSTFTDQTPMELPRGAFLGKSLPAAVKLYLSAMKRKQTIREIATALREGGVESTSDNFEGVITGCLNRMKVNGEVLRFAEGWALADFYPEHLRNRLQHGGRTKAAPKRARKAKAGKTARSEAAANSDGLEHRIGLFANGRASATVEEIAAAVGAKASVVSMTIGRMAKKKGWTKTAVGQYRFSGE